MLGLLWTDDQVKALINAEPKATAPKEIFIPLSLAVNGELLEALKKTFRVHKGSFIGGGEYMTERGEEVVEMGDMPREEFIKWANQATGTMESIAEHFEAQHSLNIREGSDPSDDPRLQRARDQVAASKRFK